MDGYKIMFIKKIRKIYYFVFIALLSLRRTVFAFNLGEEVRVNKNAIAVLHNGKTIVKPEEGTPRRYWLCSLGREKEALEIREDKLKKVWTISNFKKTFKDRYKFYMINWYSIWVNSGIQPWMKGCDIW